MGDKFPRIWYWNALRAPQKWDYPYFDFPNIDTESKDTIVNIRIALQGDSHPPVTPSHHAVFRINNQFLGDAFWEGRKPYVFETTFPLSWVTSGSNRLSIEAPGDIKSNPPMDVFLLESIDYSYPRKYQSDTRQIQFTANDKKIYKVRFDTKGFIDKNIIIYEITQGKKNTPIISVNKSNPSMYDATIVDMFQPGNQYYALTPDILKKPVRIDAVYPTDLKDTTINADYVILTYDDFVPELDRLVKWREKQGHIVKVVKISDVYNEFNAGIFSPDAIHSFVDYAYRHWSKPQLKYLFLVGDANWDFKNNLRNYWGFSQNYIPTNICLTNASNIATDNLFVTLDGNSPLPTIAVGRLTARSRENVRGYIDKILEYENNKDQDWKSRTLLVAGEYAMFTEDLNNLAKEYLYPTYDITKAYATPAPSLTVGYRDETTRHILQDAWTEGVSIVYFAGHGSHGLWENRKLLLKEDIPNLKIKKGRYPLVLSMTCFTGRFEYANDTDFDTSGICELLVNQKDGGAIATFGSTGRAYVSVDSQLGRAILKGLLRDKLSTLGDIILTAKRSIGDRDMLMGYTLFGDPGLQMQIPEDKIKLTASTLDSNSTWVINGKCTNIVSAKGTLELLDKDGKLLSTQIISTNNGSFSFVLKDSTFPSNDFKYIRCLLTDEKSNTQELGWLTVSIKNSGLRASL